MTTHDELVRMAAEALDPLLNGLDDKCRCGGARRGDEDVMAEAVVAAIEPVIRRDAGAVHRDLTSRLGYGDGITEPQADNDTIVNAMHEAEMYASDYYELHELPCLEAGCDLDEDCPEHEMVQRGPMDRRVAAAQVEAEEVKQRFWKSLGEKQRAARAEGWDEGWHTCNEGCGDIDCCIPNPYRTEESDNWPKDELRKAADEWRAIPDSQKRHIPMPKKLSEES